MASLITFALLAAVVLVAPAAALDCSGDLSGNVNEDVYVTNYATCYLKDNTVINGSVYLKEGGNLHSRGKVLIKGVGGINGRQSGWVDVSGKLTVAQVDIFQGKWHSFYGAKIAAGELKIEASVGDLVLCNTEVYDVVEFKENTGNFYATSQWWALKGWWGCSESKFHRDVKIEFLTGNVKIVDNEIEPGELYIKGVTGKTDLNDVESIKLKIERNQGEVYLYDVEAKEAELKENIGGIKMYDTEFDKVNCVGNSEIEGYDNEFEIAEGQCNRPEFLED